MRKAKRHLLCILMLALVAGLAGALLPAIAQEGGGRGADVGGAAGLGTYDLPSAGSEQSARLLPHVAANGQPGSSFLGKDLVGPITDVTSLERLIAGTEFRAKSTVHDGRLAIAAGDGIDERHPRGFGGGVDNSLGDFAWSGVMVSSNRNTAAGTGGIKGEYDLWAFPMPTPTVEPDGTISAWTPSNLTEGVRLTATSGRNERHPAIDEAARLIAYVAENAAANAPVPPAAEVAEDRIYVQNLNTGAVTDITPNFVRGTAAGQDADGWDIHSLTFDNANNVVFASDYGRGLEEFKLWRAPIAGGGAVLFAPIAGMDTDQYVYDNPDYNTNGELLFDSNLQYGGNSRRVYSVINGVRKQVTSGSKQIAQLGPSALRDTRPQWGAVGPDITFESNRTTGAADTTPDQNVWYLTDSTDATAASGVAEDAVYPADAPWTDAFRVGAIDEMSTSTDAPETWDAFQDPNSPAVGVDMFVAEQLNASVDDGDVYIVAYYTTRGFLAPAGVTDQPVVNAGNKDLSSGQDLVVEADVRGFAAPGLWRVEDAEVTAVRVFIWTPERDETPTFTWETRYVAGGGPWRTSGPSDTTDPPWADTWPFQAAEDGTDVTTESKNLNNIYTRGTSYYFEKAFELRLDGPSPDVTGFARFSNSTSPFDTSTAGMDQDKDHLIGIQVVGTFARDIGDGLVQSAPFEFLYDNISGFTTKLWDPTGNVLIVDDYMCGQTFISQASPWRGDQEESYYPVAIPVDNLWGVCWSGLWWRDGADFRSDMAFCYNDLVTGDFYSPMSPYLRDWGPCDTRRADWWRVASRGPIPDAVINRYTPELTPYTVYDSTQGDTEEEQYRGPFTVSMGADAPTDYQPVTLYPGIRGVLWSAPYAGNIYVDEGTITDPVTHATIRQFVDQGGGILLSGQDVAWALTMDGAVQSSFLSDVFGATYVSDDAGTSVSSGDLADPDLTSTGTRGRYPDNPNANPIAHPPGTWPWWRHDDSYSDLPDLDPAELNIAYRSGYTSGEDCDGACYGYERGPGDWVWSYQCAWPDVIAPTGNARAAYSYGSGADTAATFLQHPSTNPDLYWGGRTAFLAFGLEAASRDFNTYSINGTNFAECLMKRQKIVQNFLAWGRTSTMEGYVTAGHGIPDIPAGTQLANVLVTMTPRTGQSSTVYGMLTDKNGYFKIRGLPINSYEVAAYAPGLVVDHRSSETTGPDGTNWVDSGGPGFSDGIESFSMNLAPPGTISGHVYEAGVTDADGNPIPLEGIRVTARATQVLDGEASDVIDPITGKEIEREAITDANGYYQILEVPAMVNYWVKGNPEVKATLVQLNHATDDFTYGIGDEEHPANLQHVLPAADTGDVDFYLESAPGVVTGLVYEAFSDPKVPIANALVRVSNVTPAISVRTGADGRFAMGTEDEPLVPAGTQTLVAGAPGYGTESVDVEVLANDTVNVEIPLEALPPGAISGKVTSADGATPVSGVTVEAFFADETSPIATATTGADGTYRIDPIGTGDYTVRARDAVLNRAISPTEIDVTVESEETTENVDFTTVALVTWGAGVRMISSPYSYPTIDFADLVGLETAAVKLAWWVPALNKYAAYPDELVAHLTRGRGYFARFDGQVVVDRVGEPTSQTELDAPFDLALSEANGGWNLIGNPYPDVDMDWALVSVLYEGQTLTLAQAVEQGLVSPGLYAYENGGYVVKTGMAPWVGYWAKALKPGVTVRITKPDASVVSSRSTAGGVRTDGVDWSLQLTAEVEGLADRANYIGVAPEDAGLDSRFDMEEPPMARKFAGEDVTLYFPHTTATGEARSLSSDFRSSLGTAQDWEFVVDTNVGGADVRLAWPDLRSLPRTFSVTLEDLASGATVSMRSASQYAFRSDAEGGTREFRIRVRSLTDAGNPTPQVLGVDSMARGVTVSYRLTADVDMTVRILNQAGRVIRTLVSDEARAAGVHSEMWDGRDDAGRALPAGEYRVELAACAEDGAVGRATVRAVR